MLLMFCGACASSVRRSDNYSYDARPNPQYLMDPHNFPKESLNNISGIGTVVEAVAR